MKNCRISSPKFCGPKFWRVNLILIFLFLFGAAIIGRLIYLQILNRQLYKALAQGQQQLLVQVQGKRGKVFLKDRRDLFPLAINKTWQFCYGSPREIKNKEEVAEKLGALFNLDKDEILEKIKNTESLFTVLKHKLTEEEIENFKKLNLAGIYLKEEILRYYPQERFLSQVIGFLGGEGKGQYGIEGFYDEILTTEEGFLEGKRGLGGALIFLNSENLSPVQKGADILLSIDYNIQFLAEKLLVQAKEQFEIEEGQIIVADPHSGKILALADFPNFNPNCYFEEAEEEAEMEIFQNSAIQKMFEPGSVFKPITMAAALDQEKITPQTTYIDRGIVEIRGWPIYNYGEKVHGEQTMTEVLEKSINTGAVFVQQQIGSKIFLEYLEKFNFFEKTGIDLQEEVFSENLEFKKGYEINFATASFGQGIAITPIQLVRAFCAIANGGKLVKPYLVEKIIEGGKEIEINPEISENFIISRRTSSQLTAMLVSVVENGFATAAKIPGYFIAGKTGTAQIPFSALGIEKRDYSEKTIQTFVGFAPAYPQFLILIKLDNPNTKTAEYSAVPIFRELAKYIIDYWQIPPDYE
ncbi:penicillin-binding protein 2 [Patescibacteria group bacterium]|nr:penicillin-binding protein 2 [Patescibacteria group bacterium]